MKKLAIAMMAMIERISTSMLERANLVLQGVAVLLLFFAFAFGTATIVVGYILGKRQAAEVATANAGAAEANSIASSAQAETNRLKVDLSKTNLQLEEQKERTAKAETALLKERSDRLSLEKRTASRWLEISDFNRAVAEMSKFKGQRAEVLVFPVNFESFGIAQLIHGILGNAKWSLDPVRMFALPPELKTIGSQMKPAPFMVSGVYIQGTADEASRDAARALSNALELTAANGIHASHPLPDGPPRVLIFVGDKPSTLSVWVDKK